MLLDFQWSHLHRSKEQIQTRNIDTRITLQISSIIKTYHVYISSYQVIECDSVKLRNTKIIAENDQQRVNQGDSAAGFVLEWRPLPLPIATSPGPSSSSGKV